MQMFNQSKFQKMSTDTSKYESSYSESGLWSTISKYAKKAGKEVILNALKLYYAMEMGKVTSKQVMIIIGALGYLISPVDLVPDFLPGGLLDDAAVILAAVNTISACSDPEVVEAAKDKLEEWFD